MIDVASWKDPTLLHINYPIYIDPRGPKRIIEDIEADPNGGPMILTLVCGHRIERANQFSYLIGSDHVVKRVTNFSYKVGDMEHCIQCKGTPNFPRIFRRIKMGETITTNQRKKETYDWRRTILGATKQESRPGLLLPN